MAEVVWMDVSQAQLIGRLLHDTPGSVGRERLSAGLWPSLRMAYKQAGGPGILSRLEILAPGRQGGGGKPEGTHPAMFASALAPPLHRPDPGAVQARAQDFIGGQPKDLADTRTRVRQGIDQRPVAQRF